MIINILLFSYLSSPALPANSFIPGQEVVTINLFWGKGCYHCSQEKIFLEKLQQKHQRIQIHGFEITENPDNLELLKKVAHKLKVEVTGVPFTVVGDQYFIGWLDERTTGEALEKAVHTALTTGSPDIVGRIGQETASASDQPEKIIPPKLTLPLVGEIETKQLSLPVLTILIGGLDGFNPCAMWVLIFLIGLLLGMQDRAKMWILGTTFIVTSSFIYFLFMTAWLNLLLFIGLVFWVKIVIGGIALTAGVLNLREYITNKEGACKVTGSEKRQKIFARLKAITQKQQFWLALGGIILLAFAVNLVELICSASLPVVFIQILTLTPLPPWQYYLYMLIYIFVFMLDDIIVFIVAMVTLQQVGITGKYARFSNLVGGLAMIVIGILLIFKPQWLMFG